MRFRDLFKDVVIYGIGDIILKAMAFITLPIYTRIFTPDDYGILNFISTIVGLLGGFLSLGGESAYIRLFFEAKTLHERQVITSTWFGFLAIWSSSVVVLCLPLSGSLSEWSFETDQYRLLFILALLAAPVGFINRMCGQTLRNQFQARAFTGLNIISTLLTVGLSLYGVIILELGLIGILGGTLIGTIIILPIRLWSIRSMLCPVFSRKILQELLAYGVPLVPMGLASWIFGVSDRLMIGKLSALDQVGLYAVANSITGILGLMHRAVGQAWSPHAVRIYEEQRTVAPVIFGQIMTYILVGFGLLCVGMTAFSREAVMLLTAPTFYPAALAVGPLALSFVAYASTQITALGISLAKQTRYFTIFSWLAAMLNLGLNLIFIPGWGMIAASWSTVASVVFLTLAYLVTSQRLCPIVYETRRAFVIITLTVVFTVAVSFLPQTSLVVGLALKSVYCLVYVGFLIALRGVDQREWRMLSSFLHRKTIWLAQPNS